RGGRRRPATARARAAGRGGGARAARPVGGGGPAAARPPGEHPPAPPPPHQTRRNAATPIAAANTASSTRIPVTSAVLSLDPNVEIAKFFSGGGARSMAALPTATTGEPCGPVVPATSCPTATATAAGIRPGTMPMVSPGRAAGRLGVSCCGSEDTVTSFIRCRRWQGLAVTAAGQSDPALATNDREERLVAGARDPGQPGCRGAICTQCPRCEDEG